MKFREKEKILRQIEEKSYEEELDENDYSNNDIMIVL